jgi:hypothetical protein
MHQSSIQHTQPNAEIQAISAWPGNPADQAFRWKAGVLLHG